MGNAIIIDNSRLSVVWVCSSIDNTVFYADISSLAEVFDHAAPEVKERVTSLMDTLFLLTYHDAKDGAIDKLDVTREKLRTIFLEKVGQDRNENVKFLFDKGEEK